MLKSSKDRMLTYLVPALLLSVAGIQVGLSTLSTLSPWKGGGFGMFSRISNRALSCQVLAEDGERRPCLVEFRGQGEYGPFTRTRLSSLKTFPTRAKLQSILEDYMKHDVRLKTYQEAQDEDGVKFRKVVGEKGIKAMRLAMYELVFNNETLAVEMRPIPGAAVQSPAWEGE